ncbi:DUF3768 domain-containing protein [Rhizobium ruizarguesonis]|uniref:DUF3768 domain-containing protein n=1 Tax=Rhizobium ruizarguesonis TaxID=2081791 RepID=UPI001031E862|nr:DUF3768 domain-containing protein [Rhizobium ruizarguesonis]TAY85033.1 DUF3768 domain-containing protein [Rhizobium ruizarguesonis]
MSPAALRISDLNDLLRATFLTGKVVFTEGIAALSDDHRSQVVEAVQSFRQFTPDNDPYGEHDFGSIEIDGVGRVFWKIDYYDPDYRYHNENAADPTTTRRVLTIMLAIEY